jgi:siroheme synthase
MGVGNAPTIRGNLLAAGARPGLPIVIVENGTRDNERAVATTLHDLTHCVDQLAIRGPAMIFAGLDWRDAGLQRPETVQVYRRPAEPERRPPRHNEPIAPEVFL